MVEIEIHRVSCRACNEIFCGMTLKEAEEKHRQHIKKCEIIKALKKVSRLQNKFEKILGRKLTRTEVYKLLGIKKG